MINDLWALTDLRLMVRDGVALHPLWGAGFLRTSLTVYRLNRLPKDWLAPSDRREAADV